VYVSEERGLGALSVPEFPKLYSMSLLRQAWQLRCRLRWHYLAFLGKSSLWGLLCCGLLYPFSRQGQNEALLNFGMLVVLAGMTPLGLGFLSKCCKAVIPSAQANWSSLWGIVARVIGTGLLVGLPLFALLALGWKTVGLVYAICVYFPAVFYFYGWCWCHQFLYCVLACEGQDRATDLRKARHLLQGAHIELLLAYVVVNFWMQLFFLGALACLLLLVGIPAYLLVATGLSELALGLGGLAYLSTCLLLSVEFTTFWLAYHVACYAQLRQRIDPVEDLME
jgi:hypothetical protein